jgi:lipoprotein-anchoring transpeptidase ErfK/SrfK
MKSNGLKTDLIKPGMKLKVAQARFSVIVDKSQNTLILKSNEEVIKTYRVSTGKNNSTPTGTYKITTK